MFKRMAISAFALGLMATPAQADLSALEEQFELFAAEEMVVSASRREQKASEAPAAIYVITAREIQGSAALTLGDLLRRVPGFDVYRVNQGYTVIGARGLATESNNLVLVQLDGREINVELFGIPFIEQIPVTLAEIDRIEVIRGPGSALYGANAFSGVVSIITKSPENSEGYHARAAAGNYSQSHISALTSGTRDDLGYTTSARFRRANRFSEPGRLDAQSASARTTLQYQLTDESSLSADLNFDSSQARIFTTIGEMPADLFQTGTRLSYQHGSFQTDFFWNVLDTQLAIQDPTLNPSDAPAEQRILTSLDGLANTLQLESRYGFDTGESNSIIMGGSVRWNSFDSPQLADDISNEYRFGLYLQDEFRPVESLMFTAGARLDYYLFESALCRDTLEHQPVHCVGNLQSSDLAVSPRASVVWAALPDHTFRASFGRAFRKPSFFERQMQVEALEALNLNFSNPNLPNEQVNAFELGYVARAGERVRLNADFFFNQYDNFIIFQPNQMRFDVQSENEEPVRVNAYGGELTSKIALMDGVDAMASYAFLKKDPDNRADPMHKVNAEIMYRPDFGMIASLFASYISERQWRISDPERGNFFVPYTEGQTLGNYTVVDLRLGYRFLEDRLEVGVIGKNLLDQHREFPGLDNVTVAQNDLSPEGNYGGEIIGRMGFVYLEGNF